MKRILSVIMSAVMLVTMLCGVGTTAFAQDTVGVNITVTYSQTEGRKLLSKINKLRTGDDAWYWNSDNKTKTVLTDLKKLKYDYALEKIAMQRAAEIAVYFSHYRPNGQDCFTAYDDAGYTYTACGENIAYGYTTASSVHAAWSEESAKYSGQGHRRNMLDSSYTAVGIGHVYYNGVHYWVEEFSDTVNSTEYTEPKDSKTTCTVYADSDLVKYIPEASSAPSKTSVKKLTASRKSFTVKYKKSSDASGYQIQYATNKNFSKNKKTVTVKSRSTTSKTVTGLKAKKTYYVRVRAYKTVNGKRIYSDWSSVKKVKTK